MEHFSISPAMIRDIEAINRVDRVAFAQWRDTWGLRYLVNTLSSSDLRVTVAKLGGLEVIGFLITDTRSVVKVGVSHPRIGVGRALLRDWVDRVKPVNVGTMIRHRNVASTGLFSSCGFHLTTGTLTKRVARTWGWWLYQ